MNCKILETTLRDGSYSIDFKFTARDTAVISSRLEKAGFEFIEIGHGLGLHGREAGYGDASASDAEYLKAASKHLKKAKFGMFCIPGIARLEDIDLAADYGMHFIRIGTNINELNQGEKYFKRAKKHNLIVTSNLMKSYAVSASEFGVYTRIAQNFGADVVYLVDSAGCMLPQDVELYFNAARKNSSVALGFHGHNNLGLANANTLKAIEIGAAFVDSSLKGLGRSAGNAVTEMLVMIMKKRGYEISIDEFKVMDIAEKYIAPLIHNMKNTSISITGGYAGFHSSFLKDVFRYSEKFNIDPRRIIIELTKRDKIKAPDNLLEEISKQLSKEKREIAKTSDIYPFLFEKDSCKKYSLKEKIKILIQELNTQSKKRGLKSILNIVLSDPDKEQDFISDFIQENQLFITGSIEFNNKRFILELLDEIDGKIDYILLDNSVKKITDKEKIRTIIKNLIKSKILFYDDLQLWAKSISVLINAKLGNVINKYIVIYGKNKLSRAILSQIKSLGGKVITISDNSEIASKFKDKTTIIISSNYKSKLNNEVIRKFRNIQIVIDAKIGCVDKELIENNKNIIFIRPDMRAAIAGETLHQILNYKLIMEDMGRKVINNKEVVAGGIIGKKGQLVLDSLSHPSKIVGIAKGDGHVNYRYSEKELKIVKEFEKFLNMNY